jgi:hypothetical protein
VYDTVQVYVHAAGPGICRVTVVGELDAATAPTICDTLRDALIRHACVDVDRGGVSFCDCSGLSALLTAAGGRAALAVSRLPPAWPTGTAMLTTAKILEDMELGHNILHPGPVHGDEGTDVVGVLGAALGQHVGADAVQFLPSSRPAGY